MSIQMSIKTMIYLVHCLCEIDYSGGQAKTRSLKEIITLLYCNFSTEYFKYVSSRYLKSMILSRKSGRVFESWRLRIIQAK